MIELSRAISEARAALRSQIEKEVQAMTFDQESKATIVRLLHAEKSRRIAEGYEIKNAIIKDVKLSSADRGLLSAWIFLDYGGTQQGFGGFALYLPKSFDHHQLLSHAGHWIFRVMEIAGVENWKDVKGKTVRAECSWTDVRAIGHIIKDDWFCPSEDFRAGSLVT